MNGLVLLWLASLLLAAGALVIMAVLVVARALRMAKQLRREVPRRKLLALLFAASEGQDRDAALQEARRHPDLMADLAVELLELVRGEDSVRLAALFRDAGLPAVLQKRLKRGDERTRMLSAETLAFFPGGETRGALERSLQDRSGEVRLSAAMSLADIGSAPPLGDLVRRIGDATVERSGRSLDLFRRLASERQGELLVIARADDIAVPLRAAAVEALVSTGDYGLIIPLSDIARQSGLAPELLAQCVRGLGQLGHPNGREIVNWALGNDDWQVRAEAAEAAGRIGMAEAAPRLGSLLDDEIWWVRFRAGQALANLGSAGRGLLKDIAVSVSVSGRSRRTAELVLAEQGSA